MTDGGVAARVVYQRVIDGRLKSGAFFRECTTAHA
jgi:hypothetical protein